MTDKPLTARQQKALAALLTTSTITAAAEACGIPARSLHRYLADPVFVACYDEARRAQVGQAVSRLATLTGQAVQTLEQILIDPLARTGSRVAAAKVVLGLIMGSTEDDLPQFPMPQQPPKPDLTMLDDEEFSWFQRIRKKLSGGGQALSTT